MKIRAHHLLCIRNFQGKGYSSKFIENFYNVINILDENPIEIITSADIICVECPHLRYGKCRRKQDSEQKTKQLDLKIIEDAGLNVQESYSFENLKKLTKNLQTKSICKECEWEPYCK